MLENNETVKDLFNQNNFLTVFHERIVPSIRLILVSYDKHESIKKGYVHIDMYLKFILYEEEIIHPYKVFDIDGRKAQLCLDEVTKEEIIEISKLEKALYALKAYYSL